LVKTTPPHWIVTRDEDGLRLDQFLATRERIGSRGRARAALTRGKVFVNSEEMSAKHAGARVSHGDEVRVWIDRPGSAKRRGEMRDGELHILYEDEALIVLNKPAGLLTVPLGARRDTSSAYDYVAHHLGVRRAGPFIVHRIDRDTSGVVVFAKTARAQQALKEQFIRQEPERLYRAIVHGQPRPSTGTWRDRLAWDPQKLMQKTTSANNARGVDAISHYRVLEVFADATLIEVELQTGKRNQIRLQAAIRGHALIGERQYISAKDRDRTLEFARQALHAFRISFLHPIDGRRLSFEAPLPQDLTQLLTRLRQ
jgi:23S rRNA pseudouridine1911/1915/1917 synthase